MDAGADCGNYMESGRFADGFVCDDCNNLILFSFVIFHMTYYCDTMASVMDDSFMNMYILSFSHE